MGTTFAGIVIGILMLTVFTTYAVGLAYPDPCAVISSHGGASCSSPWNDLASVGIIVMPVSNGGYSTVTQSSNPSNIQQSTATSTACGAAGIASGISGAAIGSIIAPGIGTIIGGAIGYFGIGGLICSNYQKNPQAAVGVANFLNSNPITGTFGDVSAIFGIILMYFGALIRFTVDFIGYDSALSVLEPLAAVILIPLQVINGIVVGIWAVKSIIPGGGS